MSSTSSSSPTATTTSNIVNIMPPKNNSNNKPSTVNEKVASSAVAANYVPPQPSYLFEYVLDPCYTWIAQFYPRWITPNQLTVFGICNTVVASLLYFALVMYPSTNDANTGRPLGDAGLSHVLDPRFSTFEQYGKFNSDFNAQIAGNYSQPALPSAFFLKGVELEGGAFVGVNDGIRWVLYLVGFMNVLYMICDNTDGKQARRYGMCSTVGEYLDHGMDSIAFSLSVFVLVSLLFERIAVTVIIQMFLCLLLYMTHSVNFSSGTMIWGNRFVSVDEGTLLFSCGPLFVAFFPHAADAVLFMGGLRVVQIVMLGLLLSQVDTVIKYLKKDMRVLNLGFFSQIAACLCMLGWIMFHQGGTAPGVSASRHNIHVLLAPLAEWDPSAIAQHNGHQQPSGIVVFTAAIIRCFGLFVRNILTCYPALVGISIGLIASITSHIAVAAKVLFYQKESWTPLGVVLLGVMLFGINPAVSVLFMTAGHAVQIRYNLIALVSPQHLSHLTERKK